MHSGTTSFSFVAAGLLSLALVTHRSGVIHHGGLPAKARQALSEMATVLGILAGRIEHAVAHGKA